MREGDDARSNSEAAARTETQRHCPFCDAAFTARMTAWMGDPQPCACCNGRIMAHWPIKAPVRDTPELACDGCGKVLYRAP
jgi:hypothetical protein